MAAVVAKQRDLFTRRFRTVAPPDPSELQIHVSLVERLEYQCRDDVLWFHVPNGELRDKRAAAKLKAMGVKPGVADLVFIWLGISGIKVLFLELKAPKRKPSDVQKHFAQFAQRIHCHYECADKIDDAWKIIEWHGLVK
jgi:hypothetical protein